MLYEQREFPLTQTFGSPPAPCVCTMMSRTRRRRPQAAACPERLAIGPRASPVLVDALAWLSAVEAA